MSVIEILVQNICRYIFLPGVPQKTDIAKDFQSLPPERVDGMLRSSAVDLDFSDLYISFLTGTLVTFPIISKIGLSSFSHACSLT